MMTTRQLPCGERQVLLHLADLLDRDELLVGGHLVEVDEACNEANVGVGEVFDLAAGKAGPAAGRRCVARWCRTACCARRIATVRLPIDRGPLALVGMGNVAFKRFLAQTSEEATLPDHITHGTSGLYGWLRRAPR